MSGAGDDTPEMSRAVARVAAHVAEMREDGIPEAAICAAMLNAANDVLCARLIQEAARHNLNRPPVVMLLTRLTGGMGGVVADLLEVLRLTTE